jgi:hypothetical protein
VCYIGKSNNVPTEYENKLFKVRSQNKRQPLHTYTHAKIKKFMPYDLHIYISTFLPIYIYSGMLCTMYVTDEINLQMCNTRWIRQIRNGNSTLHCRTCIKRDALHRNSQCPRMRRKIVRMWGTNQRPYHWCSLTCHTRYTHIVCNGLSTSTRKPNFDHP